ncbi:MAG: hypothetical protein Kow0042_12730 [Calditrichia bacterium]
MILKSGILFFLFSLVYFGCSNYQAFPPDLYKPDLVIGQVYYKKLPIGRRDNLHIASDINKHRYEFTLIIRNIGNAPVFENFYVAATQTDHEYESSHYSQVSLVTEHQLLLDAGQEVTKRLVLYLPDRPRKIRFFVGNVRPGENNSRGHVMEELNYFNNEFTVTMTY